MNINAYLQGYMYKTAAEIIEGGKADNMSEADLAEKNKETPKATQVELAKGSAVELEHTDDPNTAKEIAKDHVEEIPDYYERLDKMEGEAKLEVEKDLGDPNTSDKAMILEFLKTQDDLDDETLHKLYTVLGVKPHEGEEVVYSALQQYLQDNSSLVDPAKLEEKEVEEGEEEGD